MANIWIEKRLVKASMVSLAAREPEGLIAACEESYETGVENAARDILCSGARVVLLSGPSGCGKTTSANKLAGYLRKMQCPAQVISMDDFYRNREDYPTLPDGTKDIENVNALDLPLLRKTLRQLLETGKTMVPHFDFVSGTRQEEWTLLDISSGLVIMEGIHALNPLVSRGVESSKIYRVFTGIREEYCDAQGQPILNAQEIRLGRRILRDVQRGYDIEATILRAPSVNRGEDIYIRPYKDQAHCILDTSFSYEPCIMAAELPRLLRRVSHKSEAYREAQRLALAWEQFRPMEKQLCPAGSMLREFICL